MKKVNSVEEYLADLPADQVAAIEKLRVQIRAAAPDVVEVISWGVPMFKVNGKYVAGVAAYKNHVSFGPWGGWSSVIDEKELEGIEHTAVTIHFTLQTLLPDALVTKIILGKIHAMKP